MFPHVLETSSRSQVIGRVQIHNTDIPLLGAVGAYLDLDGDVAVDGDVGDGEVDGLPGEVTAQVCRMRRGRVNSNEG